MAVAADGGQAAAPGLAEFFMMASHMMPRVDENGQVRYQPHRYQLTDEGLGGDAYAVTLTSVQAQQ